MAITQQELGRRLRDAREACGLKQEDVAKLRNSGGAEICPLSTLKDHYEVVRDSDKLVTVWSGQ